jgi:hypothetical protein
VFALAVKMKSTYASGLITSKGLRLKLGYDSKLFLSLMKRERDLRWQLILRRGWTVSPPSPDGKWQVKEDRFYFMIFLFCFLQYWGLNSRPTS